MTNSNWGVPGTRDPAVFAELQQMAKIYRITRNMQTTGVVGKRLRTSDGIAVIEKARSEALHTVETQINAGRIHPNLTPADYLYALNLLYNPASVFAANAEQETMGFLQFISPLELLNLTAAKGVNDHGPDGLFVGGIPSLRIGSNMGLEVKTAVSEASLVSNLSDMLKRMCKIDHKHVRKCIPGIDREAWRSNSLMLAVKSLQFLGRTADAKKLMDADKWGFRTLLVVRATSLKPLKIKSKANGDREDDPVREFFDLIIPFDLFGRPVWDPSLDPVKNDQLKLPSSYWPYDDLYELAGDFNLRKVPLLQRAVQDLKATLHPS